jgi:hypothetical protein
MLWKAEWRAETEERVGAEERTKCEILTDGGLEVGLMV